MTRLLSLPPVIDPDLPIFFAQQPDQQANHMAAFTTRDSTNREALDIH